MFTPDIVAQKTNNNIQKTHSPEENINTPSDKAKANTNANAKSTQCFLTNRISKRPFIYLLASLILKVQKPLDIQVRP